MAEYQVELASEIIVGKEFQNICIKKCKNYHFFSIIFLDVDNSSNIGNRLFKFSVMIIDML